MSDATRNGYPMRYLGDGVYASFDGYQVWLHVGAHTNPPVVALESEVVASLLTYNRDMADHTTDNTSRPR